MDKLRKKSHWAKWLLLIGLLAIGIALLYQDRKPRSHSFRKELITLEADAITRLALKRANTSFNLFKTGDEWRLEVSADKDVRAHATRVQDLLQELTGLEVLTLYSRTDTNWKDLQLDSNGVHLTVYVDNQPKAEVIIGRIEFDQQRNRTYRYARAANEKDTYTIRGMGYAIQADLNFYRDPILLQYAIDSLTRIRFEGSNESFSLKRRGALWLSEDNTPADSSRVATYLQDTQNIWGVGFEDTRVINQAPKARVIFETFAQTPIEITSYLIQENKTYLKSSRIPESPALDTAAWRKIFKPKAFFFPSLSGSK